MNRAERREAARQAAKTKPFTPERPATPDGQPVQLRDYSQPGFIADPSRINEKVVVAGPHPVGDVGAAFFSSYIATLAGSFAHTGRIAANIWLGSGAQITAARNNVVRQFLENFSNVDWLCFIDADMQWNPDAIERLLDCAHPVERPIVGALCFAIRIGEQPPIYPTLYTFVRPDAPEDSGFFRHVTYERDTVVQVDGTGAAFLLIHRTVLEKMRDATNDDGTPRWGEPFPYFREEEIAGDTCGEDLTFCRRARLLGYPIHVDTRVKIGHQKPIIVDEEMFFERLYLDELKRRGAVIAPTSSDGTPTFVVIPVKGRLDLTKQLLEQLKSSGGYSAVLILDNGSPDEERVWLAEQRLASVFDCAEATSICQMWNLGIRLAMTACQGAFNLVFLNNDVTIEANFLTNLTNSLRADPKLAAVCGNYDGRTIPGAFEQVHGIAAGLEDGTGGFAGFGFAVKGELYRQGLPPFDENLAWYYTDNDFLEHLERAGLKYGIAADAGMVHIGGGSQTATLDEDGKPTGLRLGTKELQAKAEADEAYYKQKWDGEPTHPDYATFGQYPLKRIDTEETAT